MKREGVMRRWGSRTCRTEEPRDGSGFWREGRAQGTLEYAITFSALLAVIVGLGALWHAGERGVFARLVEQAASHVLGALGALDIALY